MAGFLEIEEQEQTKPTSEPGDGGNVARAPAARVPSRSVPPPVKKGVTKPASPTGATDTLTASEQPRKDATEAALEAELKAAEQAFVAIEGHVDAPAKTALWPVLADLNWKLGRRADGAICAVNGFWANGAVVSQEEAVGWLRGEDPKAAIPPTHAEFDAALRNLNPSMKDVRTVVARILVSTTTDPVSESFRAHGPALKQYLEKHERYLSIKAVWIVWKYIAQAAGGDALNMARVRDRLSERLGGEGLNRDRDLPAFIRFIGGARSEESRLVLRHVPELFAAMDTWHAREPAAASNRPFVDELQAFLLATLGEETEAHKLVEKAELTIAASKPAVADSNTKLNELSVQLARQWLFDVLKWRVEGASKGEPRRPMDPRFDAAAEHIADYGPSLVGCAAVRQARNFSRIIEPTSLLAKSVTEYTDKLAEELKAMDSLAGTRAFEVAFDRLLEKRRDAKERFRVLRKGFDFSARQSDEFRLKALSYVRSVCSGNENDEMRGAVTTLVTQAVSVAANFNAAHYARDLAKYSLERCHRFEDIGTRAVALRNGVPLIQRALRALSLRDDLEAYAKGIEAVMGGARIDTSSSNWTSVLGAYLVLADTWLKVGATVQALPILNEARKVLCGNPAKKIEGNAAQIAPLFQIYLRALGGLPIKETLTRVQEFFATAGILPNHRQTNAVFANLHWMTIEGAIEALTGDNVTQGETANYMSEDEFVVFRRIHADMRAIRAGRTGASRDMEEVGDAGD